jgi:hypothetical protein
MQLWIDASEGRPDWDAIFDGYQSMVDYPGAHYWRELAVHYPDAKVLHTVRDPDKWFESTQATIFAPASGVNSGQGLQAKFFDSFVGPMRAHLQDRAYMTDHLRQHTRDVQATIAPERLLIYEAGQGWEPLCTFFGVPVPDVPYPSENSRAEFVARSKARDAATNAAGPA